MAGIGDLREAEQQNDSDWYYKTAGAVQLGHPDWSDQQVTDYMTNLINSPTITTNDQPSVAPDQPAQESNNNDVQSWNDSYQNMMKDIANSTSTNERYQKIGYYNKNGSLDAFRNSNLPVDNDLQYLTSLETTVPAVGNVVAAGENYINTAKEDIANLQEANKQANYQRETAGKPPLTVENAWESKEQNTPQQNEATSQAYRDVIGTPAGYLAVTPGVPAVVRGAAGLAYLPNLAHDVAESYDKNSTQTEAKPLSFEEWKAAGKPSKKEQQQVSPLKAVAQTAIGMVEPIFGQVKEAITQPGQFVSEIANDPTKLWDKVLVPAAIIGHPLKAGANKLADVALDRQLGKVKIPTALEATTVQPYVEATEKIDKDAATAKEAEEQNGFVPKEYYENPDKFKQQQKLVDAVNAAAVKKWDQASLIDTTEKPTTTESAANENAAPELTVNPIPEVKEPPRVKQPAPGSLAEQAKLSNPTFNGKEGYQLSSDDFDRNRVAELVPDYTIKFPPKKPTGIEGRENPDSKTITREEGTDTKDDGTHELRHAMFDNILKGVGQDVYNSERGAAQKYLYENRRHDFMHPDNRSNDPTRQWQENSQAFIDEYFKRPELLAEKLPGIYKLLDNSPLKNYAKYDVSHKELVEHAK